MKYLKVEKSSRTDLEMFVAVLNTQKSVLQTENETLKSELHEGKKKKLPILLTDTKNKLRAIMAGFLCDK